MINLVPLVMVEVVLVLWTPTYPPRKFILEETEMMGFIHLLTIIAYHTLWNHHELGNIQLILLVVLHLVLQLVMVNVVRVLLPPNFPPIKIIVRLMVVIFFT